MFGVIGCYSLACCGRSGKEDEGVAPSTARSVLLLRGGRFLCFLRRPNGRLQLSSMSPARLNWGQGLAGCGIVADSAKSESGVSRFGLVQELRMLHRIYVSRIADTPGKKKAVYAAARALLCQDVENILCQTLDLKPTKPKP